MAASSMDTEIANVINDILFLGTKNLMSKLQWKTINGVNTLCIKPADDTTDLEEAELPVLGTIQHELFRLTANGGWSTKFGSKLSAQRASGRLHHSDNPQISAHWKAMMASAVAIQNSKRTAGATLGNRLFVDDLLRVRHPLFEKIVQVVEPADTDSENLSDNGGETPAEQDDDEPTDDNMFSIENWPCEDEETKVTLQEMIEDGCWEPVPIPAYSSSGRLILPAEYEARLKGALVRGKVAITHQYLRQNKTDNYYADIRELCILRRPQKALSSPGKRKLRDDIKEANKRQKK